MAMTTLSSKAVGSVVKLNVGGTAKEFIVVQQGRPSTVYDESCDGTWLYMKGVYGSRQWHSSDVNDYANSTIHSYLNSTFLNLLDTNIKSAIKQVKLPYRKGASASTAITSGANGLSCKIFLLSGTELSINQGNPSGEGETLSYFSGCTPNDRDSRRTASTRYWTRSPYCNSGSSSGFAVYVITDGGPYYKACTMSYGIRPALILPSTVWVDDDGTVIPNRAPVITGSPADGTDLGTKSAAFDLQYTVSDADGDTVTVKEYLDDTLQRTFSVGGVSNTFQCVTNENWQTILNGAHTLRVTAEDGQYTTTYTVSFTKAVTAATITLKAPLAVNGNITAAVLSVTGNIPDDAVFKVEATNNAKDTQPVWQDVTAEVRTGTNILFKNTVAQNGAAFNFRVAVSRGPSGKGGSISVVGGAFR